MMHNTNNQRALTELTERIRRNLRDLGKATKANETDAASIEFQDGCDDYGALAFVFWAFDGREYCITVEDVSARRNP